MGTGKPLWRAEKDKRGNLQWKEFESLDPEATIKKLNPKKRAHQFASSDGVEQVADENALTSYEIDMLEDVNHHLLELQSFHSQASEDMVREINETAEATTLQEHFDAIAARFRAGIRQLANTFRYDHENLLREMFLVRKDLAIFKDQNEIDRQRAEYPESKVYHSALIIMALAAEGVANSSFFPQDLGLLGGFITAVGVSIGNVAISVLTGALFIRNLNHIKISRKLLGGFGILICLSLIATLHLSVAHYREAVARNPDEHLFSILPQLWSNPFGIQDMESIVLIIIGVVISILAIYKGYTWDDRYPGFGSAYRSWKDCMDEVNEHMKQAKHNAMEIFNHAEQETLDVPRQLRSQETKLLGVRSQIDAYFSCFATYYERAEQTAHSLIVTFRQTLQKVLENPSRFPLIEGAIASALRPIDPRDERSKVEALYAQKLSAIQSSLENYDKENKAFISDLERELFERTSSIDTLQEEINDKPGWLSLDDGASGPVGEHA